MTSKGYKRPGKHRKGKGPGNKLVAILATICVLTAGYALEEGMNSDYYDGADFLSGIPQQQEGVTYVEVGDGEPEFSEEDKFRGSFEEYAPLDKLGRCGTAYACIDESMMPTEDRGSIGSIKPTGWHTVRYDDLIPDKYLWNRCHLIGFQLTGENANERNLVTGTRYLNVKGMLPFEDEVAEYIRETGNHVLYRVTPIFEGSNLVCSGVHMEAESLEDEEISFDVFVYNSQPGIIIDYATGESRAA